ncbi:G-box-binding factor 4 [Spatholobus suberectus]|nr:G-box-binding factor 4 [Spatholobus suberectus]
MASSKVVSTNPDLPRDSSIISPLSSLLSDLHPASMDDLLKSIAPAAKTVDDVWKEIVAGAAHDDSAAADNANCGSEAALEEMTLEDFLTKAGAVREEDVLVGGVLPPPHPPPCSSSLPFPLPLPAEGSSSSVEPFGNGVGASPSAHKGKRRAVEEPVDKATLQKQRRMIKNRESAARSRERKQAYTSELEYLVHQLEQENVRLLNEEADRRRQRKKQVCNISTLFLTCYFACSCVFDLVSLKLSCNDMSSLKKPNSIYNFLLINVDSMIDRSSSLILKMKNVGNSSLMMLLPFVFL